MFEIARATAPLPFAADAHAEGMRLDVYAICTFIFQVFPARRQRSGVVRFFPSNHPNKGNGSPLSALPKETRSELVGFFFTYPFHC